MSFVDIFPLTEMLLKHLSIAGGGGEEVKCAMGYRCVREKDAEEGCVYHSCAFGELVVPGRGRERARVNVRGRSLEKESVAQMALAAENQCVCDEPMSGMGSRGFWAGLLAHGDDAEKGVGGLAC